MTESFPSWLTKRMMEDVKNYNLDSYLIALEGWRRGLTLTWYNNLPEITDLKILNPNVSGDTFSLESSDQALLHYFYRSRGNKVSNEAVENTQERLKSKLYFNNAGVPTPNGMMINKDIEDRSLLKRIAALTYPLVVRPIHDRLGYGSTTDIHTEEDLFKAIQYLQTTYENDEQFIIEEYVEGEEYRLYIVHDEVIAVTKKVAANVLGDGKSTIKQLVKQKNKLRKDNPYLAKKLIKLDDTSIAYLETQQMTVDDIPKTDQIVQIQPQASISTGGDPIDATENIDDSSKDIAINAVASIPELHHAGVDIIVNSSETTVVQVDATANIAMHVFPLVGVSQHVPAKILDYYYPETKNNAVDKTQLYFDYPDIKQLLRKRVAQELTLTNAPSGNYQTARYIVTGKVQKVGYRNWIRKEAIRRGLHGYTRNLENKKVVVVVGGNEKKVEQFKKICAKGPAKAKVKRVSELEWDSPIKLGFEIRKTK